MDVIILCSSSSCCSKFKYGCAVTGTKPSVLSCNESLGGIKIGDLKVLPSGCRVNWKKHRKKHLGLCGFVIRSSLDVVVVKRKPENTMSSEEVYKVLKSMSDPNEAFSFFNSVAEMPSVIHTTETCNYMLETLRAHRRVEDMVVVFDLMQKQTQSFKLALWTFLTFASLHQGKGAKCSADGPTVNQTQVGFGNPPKFMVEVHNNCAMCPVIDIHIKCGNFSQALVSPRLFKVLGHDDCVVNAGLPLPPLQKFSFNYSHQKYSMYPSIWYFQCE